MPARRRLSTLTNMRPRVLTPLLILLTVVPAFAVDGKWTPTQILEHDPAWLQELGLAEGSVLVGNDVHADSIEAPEEELVSSRRP